MLRFPLFLFLAIVLAIRLAHAQMNDREPVVKLVSAINKANEHLHSRKVNLGNSYLDSVVLKQNTEGDDHPFWLLTWQQKGWVKGGQIIVRVYMNGKVEHTFGE